MLISERYREMNTQMHEESALYGSSGKKWSPTIRQLKQQHGLETVLDYGCGKGVLSKNVDGVTNYDPCIPKYNLTPTPHDLVVCTDVLEHVEPASLTPVLSHISELALQQVFLTVATRPAKKVLADGRNAHLIIRSPGWWVDTLSLFFYVNQINTYEKEGGDLIIFAEPRSKYDPV